MTIVPAVHILLQYVRWKSKIFWENVGAIIDRPQDVELSTYGKMVDQAIQNIPSAYPACRLKAM